MRDSLEHLNKYRVEHPYLGVGDKFNGLAIIPSPIVSRGMMAILFSNGAGWDHVSVSLKTKKTPNWDEMCFVKNLIFSDEETVVQFHPKKSEYVNNWNCLHLWRNQSANHELPPSILVGIKGLNIEAQND